VLVGHLTRKPIRGTEQSNGNRSEGAVSHSASRLEALESHYEKVRNVSLRSLFSDDPQRAARFTIEAAGLFLDYSKNRITEETRKLLLQLAQNPVCGERIDAMFREKRSMSPRNGQSCMSPYGRPRGEDPRRWRGCGPGVHAVLDKMTAFSTACAAETGRAYRQTHSQCHQHRHRGSDLGPVMAYEALKYYSDRGLVFRFVSNVDGTDFAEAVIDLDPAETLSSSPPRPSPRSRP